MSDIAIPDKIPVGISSCLLGERVRYDGGHKFHREINETLGKYFEFLPFCPEVTIGLGIPREPVKLIKQGDSTRCIGTINPILDITEQLIRSADNEAGWHQKICAYIFKTRSPSCGPEGVPLLEKDKMTSNGTGIYAKRLMEAFPHMPITDEQEMSNPEQLANFVQRATIYQRWKTLLNDEPNWEALKAFHDRHLTIATDHDSQQSRELGLLLVQAQRGDISAFRDSYIAQLSVILKIPPGRA